MKRQAVEQAVDVEHLSVLRQLGFVCSVDSVTFILKKMKGKRPQLVTVDKPRFVETPRGLYVRNGTRAFAPGTRVMGIVMTCRSTLHQDELVREKWVCLPDIGFVLTESSRVCDAVPRRRRAWRHRSRPSA